jgi:hypothetical protein
MTSSEWKPCNSIIEAIAQYLQVLKSPDASRDERRWQVQRLKSEMRRKDGHLKFAPLFASESL